MHKEENQTHRYSLFSAALLHSFLFTHNNPFLSPFPTLRSPRSCSDRGFSNGRDNSRDKAESWHKVTLPAAGSYPRPPLNITLLLHHTPLPWPGSCSQVTCELPGAGAVRSYGIGGECPLPVCTALRG